MVPMLERTVGIVFMFAAASVAQAQLGQLQPNVNDEGSSGGSATVGVVLEDHPTRSDVKFVKFYSELLGFDTTTKVVLPPNYAPDGEPVSTLYFLHGTCDTAQFDDVEEPGPPFPDTPFDWAIGTCRNGPDSYGGAPSGTWFNDPSWRVKFLVVFPDVAPGPAWCGHCWWVDGVNGQGVAAESHLYQELIPAIEQVFNVRRGRNGRAVAGKSMGADGTLVQAFRHPDRWRFALALSPTQSDGHAVNLFARHFNWQDYLSDQGFGPAPVDPIHYENIEPFFNAHNAVGTGLEVLVDVGDGCVQPSQDPACSQGPEPLLDEFRYAFAKDVWTSMMTERGVDLTYVVHPGRHGTGHPASYKRFFADRIVRMFGTPAATPAVISYSSADKQFSAWGWDMSVERPNTEFLHLSGVRTDGTAATFAGTGLLTVTTPPLKGPAKQWRVEAVRDGVEGATFPAVEVIDGKQLRFTVDLGVRDPVVDQRRELVESGRFQFPRTRVRVLTTTESH